MLEELTESLKPSKTETLAKAFSRWGRGGFWSLVVMGALPLVIMVYTLIFTGRAAGSSRSGLPLVQLFSTVGLVLLVFLTFWFYRYTRIAKRLQDPAASRPSEASLRRTVWTGVIAASTAILFSMLVLLLEVGTLLYYFLSAPQAGIPTLQTTAGAAAATWVSAVDMMNLLSVILTLGGEIFALIFGLLLLFRTIQAPAEPTKASH